MSAEAVSETTPTTHTIQANGLRFSYFEAGKGPLALLLHGFPDTPHGWNDLVPALVRAGYRVVAPFTRGYAPTEAPPGPSTTLDELAQDALALIQALGHSECVLIGHDWGAATAYLAAALEPKRIKRLVTVGIPHPLVMRPSLRILWVGRHFVTLRLPGAAKRIRANDFRMIDVFYRRWSPTWTFGSAETAPVKECFADEASLEAAIGYYRGVKPGNVPAALRGKIQVPTLTIAGNDDPALDVAVYHQAARKFAAGYRVVALPGGHWMHRESPNEFREAVLSFLAEGA
jgi:pimeloyl-ACP methyl ester carboxylesterase